MLEKSRTVLCLITTVLLRHITERAQLKTYFSFDILVGMVRDILVDLLPERLNTYRHNDLKTDLQRLLKDVPVAVRCPAVVERHLCRKEDWMWRSITWPFRSPDITPRILHVCKTYGALMSSALPSALKGTVAALNSCCNCGSPVLIGYLAPFGSDMDLGNCMSLDICCVTF
jgi:hypothetical protein